MAVNHTLTVIQDEYSITNNEAGQISYVVEKLGKTTYSISYSSGTIDAGASEDIKLLSDGNYRITLTFGVNTEQIIIKHYLDLEKSIADDVYRLICDCDDCNDCTGEASCPEKEDLLILYSKMEAYKRLTFDETNSAFNVSYEQSRYTIEKGVYCYIEDEFVLGEATLNVELIKKLLAYDYLTIYFYELYLTENVGYEDYVQEKFKSDVILPCLENLISNIDDIETVISAL